MDLVREVLTFSAGFINFPAQRTADRKRKIEQAYQSVFNQKLNQSCTFCYIEALFEILNTVKMSKFELKRGYVAEFDVPFRDVKSFTQRNLEINPEFYDQIASEYLKRYPERVVFFVRVAGVDLKPHRPVEPVQFVPPPVPSVDALLNKAGELTEPSKQVEPKQDIPVKPKKPASRKSKK